MIFFSFERNRSSVPLSCGFTLGLIHFPPNKIARFRRSSRQNLAISPHKNQHKSQVKCYSIQFLTEDSRGRAVLYGLEQPSACLAFAPDRSKPNRLKPVLLGTTAY